MFKRFLSMFTLLAFTLIGFMAFAQDVPKEPGSLQDVAQLLPLLLEFGKSGKWLLFGAALTMVLVFVLRQYVLPKLGLTTKVLPLVSAVLGALVGVAGPLLMGADPKAALLAVLSGPVASTLWQAVFKYFMPEAPEEVKP